MCHPFFGGLDELNSKREFEGEKNAGSECDIHDDYVELDVN